MSLSALRCAAPGINSWLLAGMFFVIPTTIAPAYWLMLTLRDAVPRTHRLSKAEFATLRLSLLKLGARVIETASRIRLAFAAACPEAALFRTIAIALQPAGP